MRALYLGVLIGALAWMRAPTDQVVGADYPTMVPWADALMARATSVGQVSDPSVIANSGTPIAADGACHEPPFLEGEEERRFQWVWGEVDARVFPDAGRVAPNGVSYNPLFSLDLDFNIWLWRKHGLYLFAYARFWGGRGGEAGQTQGNIDYTRREFDMTSGIAWNFYGQLELRAVGFDRENFNRGVSMVSPGGNTNDGSGVEQRFYLSDEYAKLGQEGFNISKATFVSLGYFPTKSLVGGDGIQYHPGLFARAYLTWDIPTTRSYLFLDLQQFFEQSKFRPRMLYSDVGLAINPCEAVPGLEVRLGSEFNTDFNASGTVRNMCLPYVQVRFNF
jgi:hypothetical protein